MQKTGGPRRWWALFTAANLTTSNVLRGSLALLTLQVVAMSCLIAAREPDVERTHRALLLLAVVGLLDQAPGAPAVIKEVCLALLRAGTVVALFAAGLDYGPQEDQARRAALYVLAAALLGTLILLGQARRADELKQERTEVIARLAGLEHSVTERLLTSRSSDGSAPSDVGPMTQSSVRGYVLIGLAGAAAGMLLVRRRE